MERNDRSSRSRGRGKRRRSVQLIGPRSGNIKLSVFPCSTGQFSSGFVWSCRISVSFKVADSSAAECFVCSRVFSTHQKKCQREYQRNRVSLQYTLDNGTDPRTNGRLIDIDKQRTQQTSERARSTAYLGGRIMLGHRHNCTSTLVHCFVHSRGQLPRVPRY